MSDLKPLVLQILPTLSLGGAERFAVELASRLPDFGYETELISLFDGGSMLDEVQKRGIAYTQLLSNHKGSRIELVKKLQSHFFPKGTSEDHRRPVIVHTHLFGPDFWTAIARTFHAFEKQPPFFVSTEHSLNRDDSVARVFARRWSKSRFDVCVAISSAVHRYLNLGMNVPPHCLADIDGMRFVSGELRPDAPFNDPPRFISVGRLVEVKGIHTVLHALANVHEPWHYTVVGSGPKAREWQELAEHLGMASRVEFIGETTDIVELLRSSDCFLFPSRWEGLGSAAIEAASLGLPVLASDIPSLESIFSKSQRISALDVAAWTAAIRELLVHPEEVLASARKSAPSISKRFDPETVSKKYAELYQEILKERE
jgi:glycosyltransferase involved in cell wall biosynthesis